MTGDGCNTGTPRKSGTSIMVFAAVTLSSLMTVASSSHFASTTRTWDSHIAFVANRNKRISLNLKDGNFLKVRGGSTSALEDDDEEYDDEYEEEEEYDEESEEEEEPSAAAATAVKADEEEDESEESEYDEEDEEAEAAELLQSTVQSALKSKQRRTSAAKAAMSSSIQQSKADEKVAASIKQRSSAGTKKKKKAKVFKTVFKALHIPYIVRASFNPFTFMAMTRAYFASLFNISYMKEEASDSLRSALEERAKAQSATTTNKKKPGAKKGAKRGGGRAKTLSDLPQLSA